MTKKKFKIIKLFIVMALAITIGLAVDYNIAFIPPLAIIISAVLIQFFYKQVNEVTADERDYKLAGQAARFTLVIITLGLTILGSTLIAYSSTNPVYYRPGYLLLYIVSTIMVVNIISYLYYQKRNHD